MFFSPSCNVLSNLYLHYISFSQNSLSAFPINPLQHLAFNGFTEHQRLKLMSESLVLDSFDSFSVSSYDSETRF